MVVSSPTGTRMMVYHVVVNYFGPKVNLDPGEVDVSRTFSGKPPKGYGQIPGAFESMCEKITPQLQTASGRAVELSDAWQLQHLNDTIETFINQVAIEVIAAPLTAAAKKALNWVVGKSERK